jgi:hypothetical protein
MKLFAPIAAMGLLLAAPARVEAADANPPNVCLNVTQIQRTEVPDDQTIIFHMRDGKVWRNRLKRVCPMLKTSPYTQKLNGDLVCSNAQFIHVIQTGNDCVLGEFTPVEPQR